MNTRNEKMMEYFENNVKAEKQQIYNKLKNCTDDELIRVYSEELDFKSNAEDVLRNILKEKLEFFENNPNDSSSDDVKKARKTVVVILSKDIIDRMYSDWKHMDGTVSSYFENLATTLLKNFI